MQTIKKPMALARVFCAKLKSKFCCCQKKKKMLGLDELTEVLPQELYQTEQNDSIMVIDDAIKVVFWQFVIGTSIRLLWPNRNVFGFCLWLINFVFAFLLWLDVQPKRQKLFALLKIELVILRNLLTFLDDQRPL